jgi:hypothetical protein
MRLKNLLIGDIKFQFKYGFYFIYAVLTIFYICILYIFKASWRHTAASLFIFSDPAAMGLFFMGAIVLLEKSQRVLNSIAVSPVKAGEYVLSKVISLGAISVVVALILCIAAGCNNLAGVILGTFLGSAFFTLLGLIIASKINSLNQFLISTVPFELLCFLPPAAFLFGIQPFYLLLHPGTAVLCIITGDMGHVGISIFVILIWLLVLYHITCISTAKMFQSAGGVKL